MKKFLTLTLILLLFLPALTACANPPEESPETTEESTVQPLRDSSVLQQPNVQESEESTEAKPSQSTDSNTVEEPVHEGEAGSPDQNAITTAPSESTHPLETTSKPELSRPSETEPTESNSAETAHTHTAGSWFIDRAATCTAKGIRSQRCTSCGVTLASEEIPTGDHLLQTTTVAPTPLSNGYDLHACIKCTYSYQTNSTAFDFSSAAPTASLKYTRNSDGTCSVTGISDTAEQYIFIPAQSPDGDTVTSIANNTFNGNTAILYVQIPNTVSKIGSYAFYSCKNLKAVAFPHHTIELGTYAFAFCTALTEANLGETPVKTVPSSLFYGCSALKSVVLNGTETVESFAFGTCRALESVIYTDALKEIGERAFENCISLTECRSASSEHNLDTIEVFSPKAFTGAGLTEIVFSKNLRALNGEVFSNCRNLKTVDFSRTSAKGLASGLFRNAVIETLILPPTLETVGSAAFQNATLKEIVLPDTVKTIYNVAFQGATFDVIRFGSKLERIDANAFTQAVGNYDFAKVTGELSIGVEAFSYNTFTTFAFPDSTVQIGAGALLGCDSLQVLTVPFIGTSASSSNVSTDCFGAIFQAGIEVWDQVDVIPKSLKTLILHGTEPPSSRQLMGVPLSAVVIGKGITSIGSENFYRIDLDSVYYEGTAAEWSTVTIGKLNSALEEAEIYYYSEEVPTVEGNFWHYVSGLPTTW